MSSRRADANGLVIGGEPRINFLPPEVMAAKLARRARRSLGLLVILVLVVCAAGYVFATMLAIQSQLALAQEQERTTQLLSEQSQYSEARSVSSELSAVKNARMVGSANEVLWRAYLESLRATLPSGMQITATAIDSMSATDLVPVSAMPLETERVGTITLTVTAPSLSTMASWLDGLRELRAFADVWASPGTWNGEAYEFKVRLNFNAAAFEKRFFEGYVPPSSAGTDAQAGSEDGVEDADSSDGTTAAPDEAPIESEDQP